MNDFSNLPELMANKFQPRDQLIKLIEELGECSAAAARMLQSHAGITPVKKEHTLNFIDEIIDVEFLFAQMRFYFSGFDGAKYKNDEEVKQRFFSDLTK